jgi:signal transduction histidine kinase/CheY-like chemotaxis protein
VSKVLSLIKNVSKFRLPWVGQVFLLSVIYWIISEFGTWVGAVKGFTALLWGPTGASLAILVLFGSRLWPGVWLGSFWVNYLAGSSAGISCLIGVGNTLQVVLAVRLLNSPKFDFRPDFSRVKDVLVFSGVMISSTLVSAIIGALSLWWGGAINSGGVWDTGLSWWFSNIMGELVVTPLLLIWLVPLKLSRSFWRIAEATALFCVVVASGFFVFDGNITSGQIITPRPYIIFPALIWASVRFRQRGSVATIGCYSAIAVWSIWHGYSAFFGEQFVSDRFFGLQSFLAVLGMTGLSLAAVVTERKQTEDTLKKANNDLLDALTALEGAQFNVTEASRHKTDLLANVSHEIRTPLNGIIGTADLLVGTQLDGEQAKMIRAIQNSGNILLNLINQILDISKIEAGKFELESIPFSPIEIVEAQIDVLASKAHEKGLALASFIAPEVPLKVQGDPGRLGQILLNLIGNAIKFTNTGKVTVRVSLESQSQAEKLVLRFSVRDTGIGLSNSASLKLFQPYIQSEKSTARKFGGTGLGLSICKKLVELMSGEIHLESKEGMGSTFWFTAEFNKSEQEKEISQKPAPSPDLHRVLGLVLDLENSEFLSSYFSSWGMRYDRVSSYSEVVLKLKDQTRLNEPYTALFVDIAGVLKEADKTFLTQIGEEISSSVLKVILATDGFDRSSINLKVPGLFIVGLAKPFKQAELAECIKKSSLIENPPSTLPSTGVAEASRWNPTKKKLEVYHHSQGHILVAEDNPINQMVIQKQLQRLGFTSQLVSNGLEAIAAIRVSNFDLLLMDCQMPEMDGFEATSQIRKLQLAHGNKPIPIIALTAHALQDDQGRCIKAGMDSYLSKPIKMDVLSFEINKWMKSRAH